MKKALILLLWISLPAAKALDLDEKLTLRLLNLSSSKRTILINRGVEDGLVVGDHAKFYLTTGMVARGVVIKTSPARSIWSLYRIINPEKLDKNNVLNLKIATPVKITPDPSKMIMVEPIATPGKDIPISPDIEFLKSTAESIAADSSVQSAKTEQGEQGEQGEQKNTSVEEVFEKGLPSQKGTRPASLSQTEFAGGMNINRLGGTIESQVDGSSETNKTNALSFSLGIERYFYSPKLWDEKVSFQLLLHYGQTSIIDVNGETLSNSYYGPGLGVSYSFFNHPKESQKPIGYANLGFGWGRAKEQARIGTSTNPTNLEGDTIFYNLGVGLKYTFKNQWGFKLQLDYYRRDERYQLEIEQEEGSPLFQDERNKNLSGTRLQFGFTYRM